jgi:hypothetical protein
MKSQYKILDCTEVLPFKFILGDKTVDGVDTDFYRLKYKYDDNITKSLIFKTEPIKIISTCHGIKLGRNRCHLIISFDDRQKQTYPLFEMLHKIDNIMTFKFKKTIFGEDSSKYKYVPCIKRLRGNSDGYENIIKYKKLIFENKRCKILLENENLDKPTLFIINNNVSVKRDITTYSELKKIIRHETILRCSANINLLWVNKVNKTFGVRIKCFQIEVTLKSTLFTPIYFFKYKNFFDFDIDFENSRDGYPVKIKNKSKRKIIFEDPELNLINYY